MTQDKSNLKFNELHTNSERTSNLIKVLMEWFHGPRDGIFATLSKTELQDSAPPADMTRGSYEHIMWLTLTVSIDYTRLASALWNAAKLTWTDQSTRWVFSPKEISSKSAEELVIALKKYKLSRKPINDAKNWRTVALSFLKLFDGTPLKLFELYKYDASEIYWAMRSRYAKYFPFLSGASATSKILSLWLRVMKTEANVNLKNLENVPIPIDTHTARATLTTGCLVGKCNSSFNQFVSEAQDAWIEACKRTSPHCFPYQLDEPLWNLSRLGCSKRQNGKICPVRSRCKLSSFCTAISSDAIIYPKKNGMTVVDTKYPEGRTLSIQ